MAHARAILATMWLTARHACGNCGDCNDYCDGRAHGHHHVYYCGHGNNY